MVEVERGCSVSTRNLRLSALASFAAYAQNRNFEVATVFANAVRMVPVKKKAIQPRTTFTLDEVFSPAPGFLTLKNAWDSVIRFF